MNGLSGLDYWFVSKKCTKWTKVSRRRVAARRPWVTLRSVPHMKGAGNNFNGFKETTLILKRALAKARI